MTQRLPEIFMTNSTLLSPHKNRKKQGGIFQLHLDGIKSQQINDTYTAEFGERHYKTSIRKKMLNDTAKNLRTLRLRESQYDVLREKRLLTSHMSLYKSARMQSFSLDKNPETCSSFHQKNEVWNVMTLFGNRNQEISELQFKMTPFSFVGCEYRHELKRIKQKISDQVTEIENKFTQGIKDLRQQMNLLRKQTGNQIKISRLEMNKYAEELKTFKQMADTFAPRMDRIQTEI